MKAILIGHVPPARTASKQNWDESCYQKYTLWLRQYRDVIITSIFGHMNIDHFMFQDVTELKYNFKIDGVDDEFSRLKSFEPISNNETFTVAAKAQYLNELRAGWSALPKPPPHSSYANLEVPQYDAEKKKRKKKHKKKKKHKGDDMDKFLDAIGGPWGERFSMSLVSPSIVPNFFPTLRIIEYNISGLEKLSPADHPTGAPAEMLVARDGKDILDQDSVDASRSQLSVQDFDDVPQAFLDEHAESEDLDSLKKKKKKRKKKKKQHKFPVPKPPSKSTPPGPAYSPQPLSLISWQQLFANLTEINNEIESDSQDNVDAEYKYRKHFKFKVEYHTNNDSNYQMKDLTVKSWLDLAEKIGRSKYPKLSDESGDELEEVQEEVQDEDGVDALKKGQNNKKKGSSKVKKARNHLWKVFVKRAFVHTKPEEEIDQEFGSYD